MKYSAALLGLAAAVFAAPVTETSLSKRNTINYVQNYNGGAADFQSNEGAGTFSANWNGNTDFVVGTSY